MGNSITVYALTCLLHHCRVAASAAEGGNHMQLHVDTGRTETDLMIKSALKDILSDGVRLSVCTADKWAASDFLRAVIIYESEDYLSSNLHTSLEKKLGECYRAVRYPISIPELRHAVREVTSAKGIKLTGMSFNRETRTVSKNGTSVILSEKEAELFEELLTTGDTPVSREELRRRLWKNTNGTNAPDVYVSYLRRKLTFLLGEGFIVNVRGAGYVLKL